MSVYIYFGVILIFFSSLEIFSERFRGISQFNIKSNLKVFYLLIAVMGIALMSRWFVGWDWYNYYSHFQEKPQNFEIGYSFFVELVRRFTGEYQVFVALNSFIDCLFLLWIIPRYSNYPITTLLLYLGVNGLALEVDIVRNVKSIMLFLISLEFIEKNRSSTKEWDWVGPYSIVEGFLPFIGLNILGAFFHITSLIYIPLYFILPITYKKRVIMGIFILGNLYYFSNLNMIGTFIQYIPYERLQGYLTFSKSGRGSLNIFYLERVLIFLFAFFSSSFVDKKKMERYRIFQNSAYISVFIFLYIREFPIIALRLFLLFSFSYWYLFPVFLDSLARDFRKNLPIKVGVLILVIGISFFRAYNFLSFSGNKLVYPYENYFMKKNDINEKTKTLKKGIEYREEGIKREILLLY